MKSRYGIWILSICWIGLAGCSNWQNRINSTSGPGSAASLSAAPAPGSPMIQTPGTSFGEPPPPVPPPPSDPGQTLAPLGSPQPQRLDLSAAEPAQSSRPAAMYNLESSTRSSSGKSSSAAAKPSEKRSSTISKLASKAKPAESTKETASSTTRRESTIERLSSASKTTPAEKSETAASPAVQEPARAAASASSESAPAVDTTMLAQPVRKGSSSDSSSDKSSKGPQSSVLPGNNKLLNGTSKPVIYPVSNPVAEEPVDITQFS